eukprot:5505171-Amphidinium_carterae.1
MGKRGTKVDCKDNPERKWKSVPKKHFRRSRAAPVIIHDDGGHGVAPGVRLSEALPPPSAMWPGGYDPHMPRPEEAGVIAQMQAKMDELDGDQSDCAVCARTAD